MKPKKYKVMIDIYKGVLNNQLIEFTTQDHGSNVLEFEILEDKVTPYNLDGCLVRMVINGQQQDCTIADATNGLVNITLHQSMFSEVGPVFAELQIYDALNQTIRLTTPIFKYTVKKSLMDDETVQADPNYSILQNMILEVSSADEVAKQAKKTAESAIATANQAESKANQIMSNGDYAKEQGDYAKAEGDRLQGMLTLGGAPQTKFDFIENKVVQDGLIYENRVVTNRVNSGIILTNNFTISMTLSASSKTDNQYFLGNYSDSRGLYLFCNNGVIKLIIDTIALDTIKPEPNEFYNVSIVCIEGECSVFINGIKYTHTVRYVPNNIRLAFGGYNGSSGELGTGKLKNVLIYNLPRAPQEIQNNFSVLNNLPSIKELHTTDSTGKTSILNFGSDSNHVEMQDGRTLEEDYTALLKTMGKEFVSADGSPIQVPSGIEARVINAEIEGQTIKNELANSVPAKILSGSDNFMSLKLLLGNYTRIYVYAECKNINKTAESKFTGRASALDGTGTQFSTGTIDIKEGLAIYTFTFAKPVGNDFQINTDTSKVQSVGVNVWGVFVNQNDISLCKSKLEGGLNSTETIILNNSQQYPIYANEEDKANKKVISLPFEEDKVTLNDDGSATWIKAGETNLVLTGVENWVLKPDYSSDITLTCMCDLNVSKKDNVVICDKLNYITTPELKSKRGVYGGGWNGAIYMSLLKTELETADLSGFKKWLSINKPSFTYMIESHVTTHIPKELMPTILTDKTNILEAGGAVKPSSFKVTVPVDKLAEIEARLQALESTTVDVVLNK